MLLLVELVKLDIIIIMLLSTYCISRKVTSQTNYTYILYLVTNAFVFVLAIQEAKVISRFL
jgi:hypothetical protein